MSSLKLISHHLCPYVQRAAIILTENNIAHDRTYIDLANKPSWFSNISPLGKVPLLVSNDAVLFESQVIAEYLDEISPGSLHPANPFDKARHRAWIEYASETLNAIGGLYNALDKDVFSEKVQVLRLKFERVEQEIISPYFGGNTFQMIDGVWATVFRYFDVFDQIADFGIMQNLEKVQHWRNKVAERPSVIGAVPDGYADRLALFLEKRNSYISTLMKSTT